MTKESVAYTYYWIKSNVSDTFPSDQDGLHVCHFIKTRSDDDYNVVVVYTDQKIVYGFYNHKTNTINWIE